MERQPAAPAWLGQEPGGISKQLQHCCPVQAEDQVPLSSSTCGWSTCDGSLAAGSQGQSSKKALQPYGLQGCGRGLPDTLTSQFSSRRCDFTRQKVWNQQERLSARDIRITGDKRKNGRVERPPALWFHL